MTITKKRYIEILHSELHIDRDSISGHVNEIITFLKGLQEKYGEDVRIDIELEQDDYSPSEHIAVSASRIESDEEYQTRKIAQQKMIDLVNQAREKQERDLYLQLKTKFEKE